MLASERKVIGLVFTGGLGPSLRDVEAYIQEADLVAAADSGLLLAERLGVVPDYIVGDMDSLPDPAILRRYEKSHVLTYPREKDYTDTELGIALLAEKGCSRVFIVGGGGGRLDHLLGIFSLFHRQTPPQGWFTDNDEVLLVDKTLSIRGRRGEEVSFLPVGTETATMSSRGLKWPLDSLSWKPGDIGISNLIVDDLAEITMERGRLLMIRSWGSL